MTIARELPLQQQIHDLARFGKSPAVVLGDRVIDHLTLDRMITDRAAELGTVRRLVLLECANTLEPLVTYLAALRGRHPVLLVPAAQTDAARAQVERVAATYRPDVVVGQHTAWAVRELHEGSAHDLHPDLAVLLGTSGSTGTPKLVRLSQANLHANAAAIAGYLGLGPHSRAATTLPLQYCYGLSVVNSHLLSGGSLWLTEQSVIDPGFWEDFVAAGATTFAGVPYTYELLERSGSDWLSTPGLRQITQAGGRLGPDRVRDLALRSTAAEVDLFVMYGQTEATARMAYLPPHLAAHRPGTIGVPIEGGEFRIDAGELVYTGANVMLGYAESAADLALGATLTELRTGDLAVQHDDGLYEIVGRCNRVAKLFGTRLDLDLAERLLTEHGLETAVVATEHRLRVVVTDAAATDRVVDLVTGQHCLPAHAVEVRTLPTLPRTGTGKPDYAAVLALPAVEDDDLDVAGAFTTVFGRPVSPADSFRTLGGDSLTYVELYTRLERALGIVPTDWPTRTVAELSAVRPRRRARWASLETPLVLRAVAIILIVLGHTDVINILGGAHVLIVVLGYNVARFAFGSPVGDRTRALLATARDIAIPCTLWVVGVIVVTGSYHWPTAFYVNGFLHPQHWTLDWRLWFLESAIWSLVLLTAVTRLAPVDRALRRAPYLTGWGLLVGGLVMRFATPDLGVLSKYSFSDTFWLVGLGCVIAAARTVPERLLVTTALPLLLLGFFPDDVARTLVAAGGILALIWVPRIPVPRLLQGLVTLLASASLFIYLTHWQVYRPLKFDSPWAAFVLSLVVGVVAYLVYTAVRQRWLTRRTPVATFWYRWGSRDDSNVPNGVS